MCVLLGFLVLQLASDNDKQSSLMITGFRSIEGKTGANKQCAHDPDVVTLLHGGTYYVWSRLQSYDNKKCVQKHLI